MICRQTWYLSTSQMEAVPENDPTAFFLLVKAGDSIPDALAAKYNLEALEAQMAVDTKAVEAAPENKAVSMPPQVKRQKPRLVKKAKR